jgi:hypothetical protein
LYCLLVGRSSIFQSKGHDLVTVDVVGSYEHRLVFVVGI